LLSTLLLTTKPAIMTTLEKTVAAPVNCASKKDLWRKCNVNNLAENFHRYENETSDYQFERLRTLSLSTPDIERCFKENGTIDSFNIAFGLHEKISSPDSYNFTVMIRVRLVGNTAQHVIHTEAVFNPIKPKVPQDASPGTAKVPPIFKEWLTKNWLELDVNLLDDVFTACPVVTMPLQPIVPPGTPTPTTPMLTQRQPKRLRSYHFNDKANTAFLMFINKHKLDIQDFQFHLGVDMNKFQHREEFGFSPVFEVHLPKLSESDLAEMHRQGLRSYLIEVDGKIKDAVLFEYSSPCPSSCEESE